MRTRSLWALLGIVLLVCLGTAACGDQVNNIDIDNIISTPSPSAAPSAMPSATPVPGTSADVESVGIYAFGYEAEPGSSCTPPSEGERQNGQGQYKVPAGCKVVITATAFNRNGDPIHLPGSTAISWSVAGPASTTPRAETPFNREYHRAGVGVGVVQVILAGKTGTRGFENL